MSQKNSQLAFNVGYLLHQARGCSHLYEFDIDHSEMAEDLTIHHLKGTLQLTRTSDGLLAQASFQGEAELQCTRCLEQFLQPLIADFTELLTYPAARAEDPVLGIPEGGLLDLRPLLRESFLVTIPIQPRCTPDCKGLCPICGNNLNHSECNHDIDTIDPRLEVLKQLLD